MNQSLPKSLLFLLAATFLPYSLPGAIEQKTLEQLNQEADLLLKKLDEISGFDTTKATHPTRLKTVELPELPSLKKSNSPTLQQGDLMDPPFADEPQAINSSLSTDEEDIRILILPTPKTLKTSLIFIWGSPFLMTRSFPKMGKKLNLNQVLS